MEAQEKAEETLLYKIFSERGKEQADLIGILQAIQNELGFLSKKNIVKIANHLNLSSNEVYGVASFYTQFKFIKPGKHSIIVCLGTACFVKGSQILAEAVEMTLGIKPGETTEDGLFSFERVACLGCCALSPVVQIDDDIFAKMTPAKLIRQIKAIQKQAKEEEQERG